MNKTRHIAVVGAGLIGSLLAIYLTRRGYKVSVYERREDPRKHIIDGGRSINLALSNRGIRALEEVGMMNAVHNMAIPMHGRMMHDTTGKLTFQPYGKEGEYINSISRGGLNIMLLNEAEQAGVSFNFNYRCTSVNLNNTTLEFSTEHNEHVSVHVDYIVGADGAFSSVRGAMQITDRFDYSQYYIEHGYKELTIPPALGQKLERNALHIWPRESFMLIALPNPDGSFTCTLFFPFEGPLSFQSLNTHEQIKTFFEETFPDVVPLLPDLLHDFAHNPTSSLVTVKCYPWVKNNTLIIGDAAHAIVPFYGQGMNAGFEDCRILNELLEHYHDDWPLAIHEFQRMRKPDTDAIAELAIGNFVEMRDLVADEDFLLRKKIEANLHERYPDKWVPLYSMVTFKDDMPYSQALNMGNRQRAIMDEVMQTPNIHQDWTHLDFASIVARLDQG